MRIWTLKFLAFLIWGLFLFMPFIAHAGEGFETQLPARSQSVAATTLFSFGNMQLQLDSRDIKIPVQDKWSVKLNAGADTVLQNDLPADVRHDRLQLDHGGRNSFRFGLGLNYRF